MTVKEILRHRLNIQQLAAPIFETPGEVVRSLGAVQAQDYFGSLWAVGQRMKSAVESDVEKAIANKTIVRTWPMRGTLHFVPPEDARWMLKLLTPRIIARAAKQYRDEGLDAATFKKSMKVFERVLKDGKQLTRNEMYDRLEKSKISTEGLRGLFLLGYAAQHAQICFGPRKGKQPTFTLLDEWLAPVKEISRDEALGKVALKYFTSHGPATIQDFVWWTGLTVADAKKGIDAVKHELAEENIDGSTYWFSKSVSSQSKMPKVTYMLPCYDEYTVAYKERSNLLSAEALKVMKGRSDVVFSNSIVMNGLVTATWKRMLHKDHVAIEIKPLMKFNEAQKKSIATAAKRYGKFIGLKAEIE